MARQIHNELLHVSQFLWPFCTNPVKCRRPNDYHVANLAVCMMETIESLLQGIHVKKFFGVPLIIFEIEGSKDVWGRNQQESKVMHKVVSSLSFVLLCFLVFMFPRHFAFWHAEKGPAHACIKIKCQLMQITDAETGIGGALCLFMEKIITILVRQITECGKMAENSMSIFRCSGKYEPPCRVLNVSQEETCDSC